jgi:tetratricopeptide (TPR) repeat protein
VTKYRIFYSNIPIVSPTGAAILKAKGAAAPLLWLVWELSKVYKPGLINNLSTLVSLSTSRSQLQQDQVDGALDHLLKPTDKTFRFIKILGTYLSPSRIQKVLRLTLIFFGLIGGVGFLVGIDEHIRHESNLDTSRRQAVSFVEKLVQEEPESIKLRLQLAQLYKSTEQFAKAETAYDQVLLLQKNNLKALIGKAMLRNDQGDLKTAKALFVQAEKAASTKVQAEEVRAIAQKTLSSSVK